MGVRTAVLRCVRVTALAFCWVFAADGSTVVADPDVANSGHHLMQPPDRDCSATLLEPQAVNVYPSDQEPYEFLVQGAVRINDPSRADGCELRVCVEEEHGPGRWHAEGCGLSTVDADVTDYYSLTPYVDCENYADTGDFRSYVRFESSSVARVGVARSVCT